MVPFLTDEVAFERMKELLLAGGDGFAAKLFEAQSKIFVRGHQFGRSLAEDAIRKLEDRTVKYDPTSVMLAFLLVSRIVGSRPTGLIGLLTNEKFFEFISSLAIHMVEPKVGELARQQEQGQQEKEKDDGNTIV